MQNIQDFKENPPVPVLTSQDDFNCIDPQNFNIKHKALNTVEGFLNLCFYLKNLWTYLCPELIKVG